VDLQKQISILLVEDDECACEILHSMLSMRYPHATIHSAGGGKDGLDFICRCQPDIVITDINMPEMNGIEMLGNLVAIKPDTHVIVVTAHSDLQNLEKITSTGIGVELVPKPVDFEILFALIKRCLTSQSYVPQPCNNCDTNQ
jgi:YesN/AraC family two-component response regulator